MSNILCIHQRLFQNHAHRRDISWNPFSKSHNPLPSSRLVLLSPQVLLSLYAFGSCSPLYFCSVRFYQVVGFFCFLQLVILHCTQTPSLSIVAVSWGFLTFRLFPKVPCLFSNTKQNKQTSPSKYFASIYIGISLQLWQYSDQDFSVTGRCNKKMRHRIRQRWWRASNSTCLKLEHHRIPSYKRQQSFLSKWVA